jgi:hypothetical protein
MALFSAGRGIATALLRLRVQVAARGGDVALAQGGRHRVDARAALQGMAGVRVPHPVRRNVEQDASAAGGLARDDLDLADAQRAAPAPASPPPTTALSIAT